MKHHITAILTACAAALAIVSGCSDRISAGISPEHTTDYKIINRAETAAPGSLLLYLDETAADNAAMSLTKGGIADASCCDRQMDSIFSAQGVISFERLIKTDNEREEALARKYGMDKWYIIRFDEDADMEAVAGEVAKIDGVEYLQYNTRLKLASNGISSRYRPLARTSAESQAVFNDEMLAGQWHFINNGDMAVAASAKAGADINVKDAWRLTAGDPGIVVAVLDEAVQWDHPDLAANMWDDGEGNHGYNFAKGKEELEWDTPGDVGHGTHVAGTIAAVNNNGTGVCGIAGGTGKGDGVKIMSLQIMDGIYGATDAMSAQAVMYAMFNGAHIINCSWGYEVGTIMSDYFFTDRSSNQATAAAIEAFVSEPNDILDGGLAIFASGNDGAPVSAYPAAFRDCISVTAFAADNRPAYYTNYGPGCNIAAPGGEDYSDGALNKAAGVLSTLPTKSLPILDMNGEETGSMTAKDYGYLNGTSMACPHVSGVAALGLSYAKKLRKTFTREEFTSLLLSSVNDIDRYCTGTRYTVQMISGTGGDHGLVDLNKYRGNMGTGYIDAWKLLMNIEGTPMVTVKAGEEQSIPLDDFFGEGSANLTYLDVTVSDEDRKAVGLVADPVIRGGKLVIFPLLPGSVKMTVSAIGGGNELGGGNGMGGTEISREISVLVRNIPSGNGGWL